MILNPIDEIMQEFNIFVGKISNTNANNAEDVNDALKSTNLLKLLRVAKMTVEVINDSKVNISCMKKHINITLYETDNFDGERGYSVVKRNGDSTAEIVIYPIIGESDWTEFEINTINSVVTVLYLYNGVINFTKLTNKLVYYDRDMNIPNLAAFNKRVIELVSQKKIGEYGTCRFNIKRFYAVNSLIGFPRGSVIMKQYIMELQRIMGNDGVVYRIGGDNYMIIFRLELYDKIRGYLEKYTLKTGFDDVPEITLSSYAGFLLDTKGNCDVEYVMRITHKMGVIAKENKYNDIMVFNDNIRNNIDKRNNIFEMFPDAIRNEEFLVYYQPKYDSRHSNIIGAEALCRWYHNDSIIPPNDFIPILEEGTQICILDFYMLEHVCMDIRKWLDTGIEPVRVSVNFSRVHLNTHNLADNIMKIVEKHNIPHGLIEIELTETTTEVDFKSLKTAVFDLNKMGINTTVDDFGIGYSSLSIIRDLPWKVLKLDRSFLPTKDDVQFKEKKNILKHVIAMANELGLECFAEGAEDLEQVNLLNECGCYFIQGFYYSKPLPKAEFENRLIIT